MNFDSDVNYPDKRIPIEDYPKIEVGQLFGLTGYTIRTNENDSTLTVEFSVMGRNLGVYYFEPILEALKKLTWAQGRASGTYVKPYKKPSEPLAEGADGKADAKEIKKGAMIDGINATLLDKAMAYERLTQQSRQNQDANCPT